MQLDVDKYLETARERQETWIVSTEANPGGPVRIEKIASGFHQDVTAR